MSSVQAGTTISSVEVTNISRHGVWLLIDKRELFMPFEEFPWFKEAPVVAVLTVERLSPEHLYWPLLDVDLTIDSIEHPENYPLQARSDAQQPGAADPGRSASGSADL